MMSALRSLLIWVGLIGVLASGGIVAAQGDTRCGFYLSVGVDNISAGFNEVITWTSPGGVSKVSLHREFWQGNNPNAKPTEIRDGLDSVGGLNLSANAEGFTERYTLYADGDTTTPLGRCVVTVNSPTASNPQVVTFLVFGREAIHPGSAPLIGWETRNVREVQLLAFDPNSRTILALQHLPATGQTTIHIPADYGFNTLTLYLALDDMPIDALPSASILNLPINLSVRLPSTPAPTPTVPLPITLPDGWRLVSGATLQRFEHGLMLWLPGVVNPPVLIVYDDHTWQAGAWRDVPSPFNGSAPKGTFAPWYGHAFGKVWAQNADVRAKLGWAIADEGGTRVETRSAGSDWLIRLADSSVRRIHVVGGRQAWELTFG